MDQSAKNEDVELWRKVPDYYYYAPSVFVTKSGGIGINVGGFVFVKTVEEWHKLAKDKDEKDSLLGILTPSCYGTFNEKCVTCKPDGCSIREICKDKSNPVSNRLTLLLRK
jgi:hypothetical protein